MHNRLVDRQPDSGNHFVSGGSSSDGYARDKLIVSNGNELTRKYRAAGVTAVKKAVRKLIKADASRGIVTEFVDLSDATAMASYGAPVIPPGDAGNANLNKQAIDKVFTSGDVRPRVLDGSRLAGRDPACATRQPGAR